MNNATPMQTHKEGGGNLPIRVLVVDDSILLRTNLQLNLHDGKEIAVVGLAANADEAMRRITELSPDVVTLDVEMPGVNGIQFLKTLIPKRPIPVVIVSAMSLTALDALDAGAVEFVKKPVATAPGGLSAFYDELKGKVKIAASAKVRVPGTSLHSLVARYGTVRGGENAVIAIGASTGGTEAIIEVIKELPVSTPGIVIVQHMPATFTKLYAQRLNQICKMSVKEAEDYDRVSTGSIIIAAGEYHMRLKKDRAGYFIRSERGDKVSGHCPSVDVLFDSVADAAGKHAVGVLLTGMGADGARGIKKMRDCGCYTIGQDKDSCVVYGMPMEAYKIGGISRQLPLDQIGGELVYHINRAAKEEHL